MERRTFLRGVAGLGACVAIAGCSGNDGGGADRDGGGDIGGDSGGIGSVGAPPPRRAAVFEELEATNGDLVIHVESSPWVESRADLQAPTAEASGQDEALGAMVDIASEISPVGGARGAKGSSFSGRGGGVGRGHGGGYAGVPGHHGRHKHHGDDDDEEWREAHEDEIERYRASVATVAVGRMAPASATEESLPDGGPLSSWDQTWDVSAGEQVSYDLERAGWYRTASKLHAEDSDHTFGWESVDAEVTRAGDGFEVESEWKLSQQL